MGMASTVHDAHNIAKALEYPTVWTIYTRDLECHVLEESRKFYRSYGNAHASQLSSNKSISAYLMLVRTALVMEESRCAQLFSPRTTTQVSRILLQEMVLGQHEVILDGLEPYCDSLFSHLFSGAPSQFSDLSYEAVCTEFEGLANIFFIFVLTAKKEAEEEDKSGGDITLVAPSTSTDPLLEKLAGGFFQFCRKIGESLLESQVMVEPARPSGNHSQSSGAKINKKLFPTPSSSYSSSSVYSSDPVMPTSGSECKESPVVQHTANGDDGSYMYPSKTATTPSQGDTGTATKDSNPVSCSSVAPRTQGGPNGGPLFTPVSKHASYTPSSQVGTGHAESESRSGFESGRGTGASSNRASKQREVDVRFTEEVMAVIAFVDAVTQKVFNGHSFFLKAARKALKHTVNYSANGFVSTEMFANYCDTMIRVGNLSLRFVWTMLYFSALLFS